MIFKSKKLAILGSTGSIGTQTLDVVRAHPDKFNVEILTAHSDADSLIRQAIEFKPDTVIIVNKQKYNCVADALRAYPIKVFAGEESLIYAVQNDNVDMVIIAIVGFAGLIPTIHAIKSGKRICLANKESLVIAGELIKNLLLEYNAEIIPIDSEHSAIFQCLVGENENPIEEIILTSSGGPFRGKKREELLNITKEQALKHPNWNMGPKISIDSATLMNKGLEMIEAHWLFNLPAPKIKVLIHPQSIIHSLVRFEDGSIKAQLGVPDMRIPIQYALSFPHRLKSDFPRYDFNNTALTFEKPDLQTFPCLELAYQALEKGGNMPCVLNAANEVAVELFLNEKIPFLEIPEIIRKSLDFNTHIKTPSLEDYFETDKETRERIRELKK